jgi:uncharacterized protein (DUF4415 family)
MAIVKYTLAELKKMPSQTDWKRVKNIKDKDIDFSGNPELDDNFWRRANRAVHSAKKPLKRTISIRLHDYDLSALRRSGRGWQTRISNLISEGIRQGVL